MAQVSRVAVAVPLAIAAAIVIWVIVSTIGIDSHLAHRLEGPMAGSFPLPPGTRIVRIKLAEGTLSILPGDSNEIRFQGTALRAADTQALLAQLEPVQPTFRYHEETPDVVVLEGPELPAEGHPDRQKVVVTANVWIPPSLEVEAFTDNGKLGAAQREARVHLETRHGDLYLKQSRGPAKLRGHEGRVQVDMHRGDLDAEGSFLIKPEDPRTRFMMQIYMAELGPNQLRVVNRSGPVQVWLPQDAQFDLDMRAHDGRASNRFGIKSQPLGSRGVQMKGRVGDGGPTVFVESLESGSVSVSPLVH